MSDTRAICCQKNVHVYIFDTILHKVLIACTKTQKQSLTKKISTRCHQFAN